MIKKTYKKVIGLLQAKCNVCFFLHESKCILSKNRSYPCDMKVCKINGVDNIEFYVNLVNSRKISVRALYFSIASLLAAFIAVIISYMGL